MKTLAMTLVATLVLAACDDANGGGSGPTPTTRDPAAGQVGTLSADFDRGVLGVTAAPDPPVAGASVTWTFTVTNTTDEPLVLTFPSGQRAEIVLSEEGEEVYRWSEGQVFTQAVEEVTIEAGGEESFELEGAIDVTPGTYELIATLTSDPPPPPIEESIDVEPSD